MFTKKFLNLTSDKFNDENFVDILASINESFRFLKCVKISRHHFGGKKKRDAMVRQLGVPTFFLTLSAAETRWPELLGDY